MRESKPDISFGPRVATHSPILLAYPNSRIYEFSEQGILETRYESTDAYRVTRGFMDNRERFFALLLAGRDP